jgi:three-Cys-motif partner protein
MITRTPIIIADDGLIAEQVGIWTVEKHNYLKRYLDISRAARKKFLGSGKAGATFIDLFCATGRAQIRETGEWIDGSALAAWKIAEQGGAPFSEIFIADIDDARRSACAERLRRAGAPVREIQGAAVEAANKVQSLVNPYGLHFVFLDPYNLAELDFSIIRALSKLKRIDC